MSVLEDIKAFLLEKVTPTIKLQKSNDNNVMTYELVNPAVHVGWIPPKGYLPEGMESAIPCLIVGLDEGSSDYQDKGLNIRISAAVFSPGLHKPVESGLNYTPDFQGYEDLLNLIDRTVDTLKKNPIIKQKVTINESIKWGMYQDQPYPYWYGWITFSVSRPAIPPVDIVQSLL
jgi:hypothetical protein